MFLSISKKLGDLTFGITLVSLPYMQFHLVTGHFLSSLFYIYTLYTSFWLTLLLLLLLSLLLWFLVLLYSLQFALCFNNLPFPIKIFRTHTFSTIVNPSSLSVLSPLYAVLCSSLSRTYLLYQTLCCLCSTALTAQFIW